MFSFISFQNVYFLNQQINNLKNITLNNLREKEENEKYIEEKEVSYETKYKL